MQESQNMAKDHAHMRIGRLRPTEVRIDRTME